MATLARLKQLTPEQLTLERQAAMLYGRAEYAKTIAKFEKETARRAPELQESLQTKATPAARRKMKAAALARWAAKRVKKAKSAKRGKAKAGK